MDKDIDKIKKLESELQDAKDQLQQSNDFLEEITRSVRGPLYSIMELTRMAKEDEQSEGGMDRYLDRMSSSGANINEAIDDIVAFRQIITGKVKLHPEKVYLSSLLQHVSKALERTMSEKNLDFTLHTNFKGNPALVADDTVLFHTLRKFVQSVTVDMTRNGFLSLSVSVEPEDMERARVSFRLEAHGAALRGNRVELLYMPYEELHARFRTDSSSLDSGVVIFRSYAHEMGTDALFLETDEENIVRMVLSLSFPIAPSSLSEQPEYHFKGKRILVADDDEINLEVVEHLLRSKGAEVLSVRDGREMLLSYRTEHGKFDLLLMDLIMPDLSGIEVARTIRSTAVIPSAKTVPLIGMTADAIHDNYEETKKAGMNACLIKPIDADKLYQAVAECLSDPR